MKTLQLLRVPFQNKTNLWNAMAWMDEKKKRVEIGQSASCECDDYGSCLDSKGL